MYTDAAHLNPENHTIEQYVLPEAFRSAFTQTPLGYEIEFPSFGQQDDTNPGRALVVCGGVRAKIDLSSTSSHMPTTADFPIVNSNPRAFGVAFETDVVTDYFWRQAPEIDGFVGDALTDLDFFRLSAEQQQYLEDLCAPVDLEQALRVLVHAHPTAQRLEALSKAREVYGLFKPLELKRASTVPDSLALDVLLKRQVLYVQLKDLLEESGLMPQDTDRWIRANLEPMENDLSVEGYSVTKKGGELYLLITTRSHSEDAEAWYCTGIISYNDIEKIKARAASLGLRWDDYWDGSYHAAYKWEGVRIATRSETALLARDDIENLARKTIEALQLAEGKTAELSYEEFDVQFPNG